MRKSDGRKANWWSEGLRKANARLGLLLVPGLVNCFVASLLPPPVLLHCLPLKVCGKTKPKRQIGQYRRPKSRIASKKRTGPKPGLC